MSKIQEVNDLIKLLPDGDANEISDGYHTFGELYDHRITLYLALCGLIVDLKEYGNTQYDIWWSKFHHDGTRFPGWIIVGIDNLITGEQITYHLPEDKIHTLEVVLNIPSLQKAPEYDGHTSGDVLNRLTRWFINN